MQLINHIAHEHKELLPRIEQLKETAARIGTAPDETVRPAIDDAYSFLSKHLLPHAHAEDEVLYPLIARYTGTTATTDMMSREHAEVGALTARLGQLIDDGSRSEELREVLYSLHALILLHFKKEEEFFLPVLETHLTEADDEAASHQLHHM